MDFCSRVPTSLNSHLGLYDPKAQFTFFPPNIQSSDSIRHKMSLLLVPPGVLALGHELVAQPVMVD